jgi:5-methylthioribose kinase
VSVSSTVSRDLAVWSAADVLDYLRSAPDLGALIDAGSATVRDMSTGNLNSVFLVTDAHGKELFLKQAPPHMRVNPNRVLSSDRILHEAAALSYFQDVDPGRPVGVLAVDSQRRVVILESLSDHADWRTVLNEGGWADGITGQLGEFVARTFVRTHPMLLGHEAHAALTSQFANPELCRLTDAVIFDEPFRPEKPHHFRSGVASAVSELWADVAAMSAVSTARARFWTVRQSLLHGDLHSGSVMISRTEPSVVRIIDPEFAFVGPVGFDLGLVLGSLLTQAARAVATEDERHLARVADSVRQLLDRFTATGRELWGAAGLPPEVLAAEQRESLVDAALMGSCEALRRLVHVAPVADLETLEGAAYVRAGTWLLRTCQELLTAPRTLADPDQLDRLLGMGPR